MPDLPYLNTLAASPGHAGKASENILAGRYQMMGLLGKGGMGEVWEARHLLLDRVVALKLLNSQVNAVGERMITEARALARVRHPSVVEVYDCGTLDNGTHYIAMERLVGETLARAVRREPLAVAAAVQLFVPIFDGLAAAHRVGVIHRDLKPENIFLVDHSSAGKVPKILDFGIARIEEVDGRTTLAGTIIGTPAYMSPEQLRGERCAVASDLWSATVALYEVITGQPPFLSAPLHVVKQRVLEAPLPYPRKVAGLDGRLWSFLARGLRKLPDQRFASAEAMRDELIAWLAKAPPVSLARAAAMSPYDELARSRGPDPPANMDAVVREKLRFE